MMIGLSNSEARARLVEGVVSDDRRDIIGPNGLKYKVKNYLVPTLIPGEKVRFIPHQRSWKSQTYAGEVWLQNERHRRRKPDPS
ncbi:MAG: hypothetical protein Q7R67_00165 [bacterium]|nr:hypothetical protein [bacterium]